MRFAVELDGARQRLVTGPRRNLIPDADLDEFWATLEPATIDFMIGEWQGGEFDTGHRENGTLALINWFGKTFNSATDAKPLVCLDADGNKYSNTENGEGSLWMEEFRGEVIATMVFDGQPVHDHFKKIDDHAVMGIMNGKNALDMAAMHTSISNGSSPVETLQATGLTARSTANTATLGVLPGGLRILSWYLAGADGGPAQRPRCWFRSSQVLKRGVRCLLV